MSAVDELADKLIEAAYRRFGGPAEFGGQYVDEANREGGVPRVFRRMVEMAGEERSPQLFERCRRMIFLSAYWVMCGAVEQLKEEGLSADHARVIEALESLLAWEEQEDIRRIEEDNWRSVQEAEISEN